MSKLPTLLGARCCLTWGSDRRMLTGLAETFPDGDVVWNKPAGGFFLTVSLPFEFGRDELRSCAADHGVMVTPMSFFALRAERTRQVRLSFSSVEPGGHSRGPPALGWFRSIAWRPVDRREIGPASGPDGIVPGK